MPKQVVIIPAIVAGIADIIMAAPGVTVPPGGLSDLFVKPTMVMVILEIIISTPKTSSP